MYIGNVILLILNLPLVGVFVNLLRVPFRILFPIVLLICLIGTYTVNFAAFDLIVLLCAGVLGYIFRNWDYEIAPLVLAMVLGPGAELTFRQSLMGSGGTFSVFVEDPYFTGIHDRLFSARLLECLQKRQPKTSSHLTAC